MMTQEQIAELIKHSDGKILRVTFTKRTTGETRVLVGRMGVTSHLKGGEPAYDREAKRLICIFDMQKGAYRSIPIEGIQEIAFAGDVIPAAQ